MSKVENREEWEDNHKTSAESSQADPWEGQASSSAHRDLPVTSGELGPKPNSQGPRVLAWPLPPSYNREEDFYEMQDIRPPVPQIPGLAAAQAQPAAETPRDRFNIRFYKPKQGMKRRYFIALIIFLVAIIVILATVFGTKKAHKNQVIPTAPASLSMPLATTVISTKMIPTTLVSTEFTSSSSILATTISEVSTTTQVTTQPTTIIDSTTILQPTTLIDPTTLIQSTLQIQSTTLAQLSTITQASTSVQVSTRIPVTSIQSTTIKQTTTVTSLPANTNPDSVVSISRCWDMLENICANATRGPASFGDCGETLSIFYCGMIQNLKFRGIIPASNDASLDCPGMLDFCEGAIGRSQPGAS